MYDAAATSRLEGWIDAMDAELPQLRNFILPSGGHNCSQALVKCSVMAQTSHQPFFICMLLLHDASSY